MVYGRYFNMAKTMLRILDALLSQERSSRQYAKPTDRNYYSLLNYLWNEKSIVQSEITFSGRKDDFIILTDEQKSPLHAFVEDMIYKHGNRSFQVTLSSHYLQCRLFTLYHDRTCLRPRNSANLLTTASSVSTQKTESTYLSD
jgi:hypothetical protein